MIYVVGAQGTPEYTAALDIRDMIVRAWPSILESQVDSIGIVAGAKCHGQQIRDIDILLFGTLGSGLHFTPFLSFERDGQFYVPDVIQVANLCLVIEVKDHSFEALHFVGTMVEVRYQNHWHNASEQNEKQVYSVKGYLEHNKIQPPWITPLLWLRNIANSDLPPRPHSIIGSEVTWDLILNVVAQTRPPHYRDGHWVLDAANQNPMIIPRMTKLFTAVIEPTRLDRQRMERLNSRSADVAEIKEAVGSKLVLLRGRGGTGKTMRLLQLANQLVDDEGARVLILTYNKALVADIRRLLTILGKPDRIDSSAIRIQTVHSFLRAALQVLGIVEQDYTDFLQDYERIKNEALAFIQSGALSPNDIDSQVALHSEAFTWDYVFIDEAQDWPGNERDLLLALYPFSHLVVADGVDQLIRSTEPTDWRVGVPRARSRVFPLRRSLRMKTGLARFVTSVAARLNLLGTEWEISQDLPGGRVIILDGSYFSDSTLHKRLLKENVEDGNAAIDMLFCVPPNLVIHDPMSGAAHSVAARTFAQWGYPTWDGVSEDVRDGYPTDIDQLRIVQYESCRGLEGWTVVNLGLDAFYEHKLRAPTNPKKPGSHQEPGDFLGDHSAARLHAARWLLIPLTRAIDTLVIQLDHPQSILRTALQGVAAEYPEYVHWLGSR